MANPLTIPRWRQVQQPVWIACTEIRELPELEEYVVQFMANGKQYTAFVPTEYIDFRRRALSGQIIADIDEGVLVDIPTETMNSGPRIIVTDSETSTVFV